jgi:hypothetical protein
VDHTFVYDTSGGGLPDNRAYEMVTPPQKNGALIGRLLLGLDFPDISEDGSRVEATSIQCLAGAGSCSADRSTEGEPFLFSRSSGGWVTTALAPPATVFAAHTARLLGAEAGTALYDMLKPPANEEDDWYARQPGGLFLDVGPVFSLAAVGRGSLEPFSGSLFTMATADLSRVVWGMRGGSALWPSFDATAAESISAYEYVGGGGSQPVLVGVTGPAGSTSLISVCGTLLGDSGIVKAPGELSADGRTVFFTAFGCGSGSGANAGVPVPANTLYARIDESRTVLVSGRSPLDCTNATGCATSPASSAQFVGASADGSKAFFLSEQQLTDSASEGSTNLYEYDFAGPAGHNLVAVSAGASGGGPGMQGVMAVSGDGSHVYFVASGVLTGVANGEGQVAVEGADNLYVFKRDARYPEGHVAFIATLPGSDANVGEWFEPDSSANVTPDGRFLVFLSGGRLTADDTSDSGALQVFRYDAQTGALVRVSVGNDGFNDNGNAGGGDAFIVPASHGLLQRVGAARSDPTMSNDGSFVFFESPVGLTPRALNDVRIGYHETRGVQYAENVYEYHEGHVYLISDGRDVSSGEIPACEESRVGTFSSVCLAGVDGSGANVFFTTADQMVPSDTDTQVDYYDARVCTTGEPCIGSVPPVASCEGEACHGTPAGAPSALGAASTVFSGPGNLAPPTQAAVKHKAKPKAKHRAKRKRARKRRARKSDRGHQAGTRGGGSHAGH